MTSTRYIEIDSTYRDRTLWPLPSQFDVIFSNSGRRYMNDAFDPVSLSAPISYWTSNQFNALGGSSITVTADLTSTPVGSSSDLRTFVILGTANQLQTMNNYYENAVISSSDNGSQRRILTYTYLGNDRALITVDSSFGSILIDGLSLTISDPTDLTDINFPLIFIPNGRNSNESYNNMLLYNETRDNYTIIVEYNEITHLLTTTTPIPITWTSTDNFSIRKEGPILSDAIIASSTTQITISSGSSITNAYTNMFLRIRANSYGNSIVLPETEIRRITFYDGNTFTYTVSPPFSSTPIVGSVIEILPFSYDNFNPINYSGSTVSQQELVCYEIELISLIIPNQILKTQFGGRAVYYPYLYVELSNLSSPNSGLNNIIYSNNPNANKMLFRAPINDTQQLANSLFLKIDGNGCVQTIKFKPNDNLRFSVHLNDGALFETIIPETYSPLPPNGLIQISAMFSIKRL